MTKRAACFYVLHKIVGLFSSGRLAGGEQGSAQPAWRPCRPQGGSAWLGQRSRGNRKRTCPNAVGIPPHSVNNGGKSKFGLSFGQACQGGRGPQGGGKEEGVGVMGWEEAAEGKESSLANPCPGQRSDARRVCLFCVNCNQYCNLPTFLSLHPITLSLNYCWNKCTAR